MLAGNLGLRRGYMSALAVLHNFLPHISFETYVISRSIARSFRIMGFVQHLYIVVHLSECLVRLDTNSLLRIFVQEGADAAHSRTNRLRNHHLFATIREIRSLYNVSAPSRSPALPFLTRNGLMQVAAVTVTVNATFSSR